VKPALSWAVAAATGIFTGLIAATGVGIPAGWAVLIALPITAGVLLAMLSLDLQSMVWHEVPPQQHTVTVHQASNLANQFDEAAKDQHRFNVRVRPGSARSRWPRCGSAATTWKTSTTSARNRCWATTCTPC
jgi:hypothetical protein